MNDWWMLTLIGEDRPGIVAAVTQALFDGGWSLGEASMMRLGGNFAIMLMARGSGGADALGALLNPIAESMGLRCHIDAIAGGLHRHQVPNLQVRVSGADRAGIVAQVTGALAGVGFNILELESDVAGTPQRPIYIMNIQGCCEATVESVETALAGLGASGVDVDVCPVETLIG